MQEVTATKNSRLHERDQFYRAIAKYREDIQAVKDEEQELRHQLTRLNDMVKQMERAKGSSLARFGDWMPRVVERIEAAHRRGKFERKPIGPLG